MVLRANDTASEAVMGRVFHVTVVVFRTSGGAVSGYRIRSRVRIVILFPFGIQIQWYQFVESAASRVVLPMKVGSRVSMGDAQLVAVRAVQNACLWVARRALCELRGFFHACVPRAKCEPGVSPAILK